MLNTDACLTFQRNCYLTLFHPLQSRLVYWEFDGYSSPNLHWYLQMKQTHWSHSSYLFWLVQNKDFVIPALILAGPKLTACFGFSGAAKVLQCLYKTKHDWLIKAKFLRMRPIYWPPSMAWVCAPLQTWSGRVHSSWCLKTTASAPGSCGE